MFLFCSLLFALFVSRVAVARLLCEHWVGIGYAVGENWIGTGWRPRRRPRGILGDMPKDIPRKLLWKQTF